MRVETSHGGRGMRDAGYLLVHRSFPFPAADTSTARIRSNELAQWRLFYGTWILGVLLEGRRDMHWIVGELTFPPRLDRVNYPYLASILRFTGARESWTTGSRV